MPGTGASARCQCPAPGDSARRQCPVPVPGAGARWQCPVPVPGASARCQCPVTVAGASMLLAGGTLGLLGAKAGRARVVGCVELCFKLNSSANS